MKMYVGGQWTDKSDKTPVINPYDGAVVDTVPKADLEDVETALETAARAAAEMAALPTYRRYEILRKAADIMTARAEDLARTITLEEGKVIGEARGEVVRAIQTISLSADETRRLHGETVPLDASPTWTGQFGFTLRVPCGVVVAICPFNFPLNLVAHKVGPAIAAGNAVIIKPANDTPLSSLKLTEILLEAGVPAQGVQCITGSGGTLGNALCSDPRVRKISFTGSRDVGERITHVAGIKKVTMELGSNAPLIIMPDVDLDEVALATAANGTSNAGQSCISTQRVLVDGGVYGDFLDALKPRMEAITTGNPLDEAVGVGPLIREEDAIRVNEWINEAVGSGARVVAGGGRSGAIHQPTVVADVRPEMRVSADELFGPAVAVTRFSSIDEAIALANDSRYGLSAGIFTHNLEWAMRFAREAQSGVVQVNSGPNWRADLMPYGGLKESGIGKEGPRYAVEEMTELKMVVFHLGR